jgi:hypothetical protein
LPPPTQRRRYQSKNHTLHRISPELLFINCHGSSRLSRNSRRASHDDGIDFSMGVVSKMVQDLDSLNDDR